ncbi:MAG: hypothetical protein ABEJ27_00540 [Halodesulfurarchaeum sp.]
MDVSIRDRLELVGGPLGIFVALVGIGTLIGQPWQYATGGGAVTVLQVLGALSAIGVGAGIVYLVHVVGS